MFFKIITQQNMDKGFMSWKRAHVSSADRLKKHRLLQINNFLFMAFSTRH